MKKIVVENRRLTIRVADGNTDRDLRKKVLCGDQTWAYGYDIETIISMEAARRAKTQKEHIKFGRIDKILLIVFALTTMAWYSVTPSQYIQ